MSPSQTQKQVSADTESRPPSPYLQELTEYNRLALRYYHRAREILAMPRDERKAAIGDDERLAAEVTRIYQWRKENAQQ